MTGGITLVLGGIGMFLFGMKIMTEALRETAGSQLRHLLARFTTTPLAGVVTGAVATTVVQSSNAVTVMTIGFVGAGLLSFVQAIGVLYGANIGTTATGWMVAMLGFKIQFGTVALPGLFGASLMVLLGKGRWARIGRLAAGLCMLFVGLDMMQAGASGFGEGLTPRTLPDNTFWGRLQLVGIGLAVTLVMQSSSAGVAVVLVLLGSGGISFEQAAALVIGINLGATITALLAGLGGSQSMRQTALANLLFNIGSAILAFTILSVLGPYLADMGGRVVETTALAMFHTGFNIVGTLVFLPFTAPFARFVEWLVPERAGVGLEVVLDPALLGDEGAAMDAAQAAMGKVARHAFKALGRALQPVPDMRGLATLEQSAVPAVAEIEQYLTRIVLPEGKGAERERYGALLHQTDHLTRLLGRLERRAMVAVVMSDPALSRPARALGAALRRAADPQMGRLEGARLQRLSERIEARTKKHRRATLLHEHVGLISVSEMFDRTDAMRWLRRVAEHAARIAHYDKMASDPGGHPAPLAEVAPAPSPAPELPGPAA